MVEFSLTGCENEWKMREYIQKWRVESKMLKEALVSSTNLLIIQSIAQAVTANRLKDA